MKPNKLPVSLVILACLYIVVGGAGLVFHARDLLAHPYEGLLIELTELVGLVAGAFMLFGRNWARWLALAWIVFHVVLSAFHPLRELLIHSLLCILIVVVLFRPAARRYFRGLPSEEA